LFYFSPVNEAERCLVPACRRITNTHAFPRYPDQRKKWICNVYRRADKLRPNALPILDKEDFPPNVMKEYPKIIPMPKIDPDAIQPIQKPMPSSMAMTQTIIVKQVRTTVVTLKESYKI
jgi:hypothetical protein